MPLSWNEIRDRAHGFARTWKDESRERAEAQTFWNEFFEVFGLTRRRVAQFEKPAARSGGSGFIDLFWKGKLIAEHKSRGASLDKAYDQALDYFSDLKERDLPRYVIVSDFARFRVYDLDSGTTNEFELEELPKQVKLFAFIAGYQSQAVAPQSAVNIKAAERMGRLHDELKATRYEGHRLEVLLVRLLFCMFADDTGIFQPAQSFRDWIEKRTAEDGSDLGAQLTQFFEVLNTPRERRLKTLDEQLAAFEYVNGKLFEETLPIPAFNRTMREALLEACALDWSKISPAIFGALFQSIMDKKARSNLGAHYTSEQNILKVIRPLFLDELRAEFERVKGNKNRLFAFHNTLRRLHFLDPACGCGNFLAIAYRELRLLELDVLRVVERGGTGMLEVHAFTKVDVDQFYGIEIEEFPAQIAQVALWLVDHQMNQLVSNEFGLYFARIPLQASAHIHHRNALEIDWNEVVPNDVVTCVLGNPPFLGKQRQSAQQKKDLETVCGAIQTFKVLDYVAAWYVKAAAYVRETAARCAFVSTSSIVQGEQVGVLWGHMLRSGVKIHFAHRTFRWSNEAKGVAAVHCVIIGFGTVDRTGKQIFEYDEVDGTPHAIAASNINPYLVDAADLVLLTRHRPICNVPEMDFGNMPNDGGHLLLSDDERAQLLAVEPLAAKWIRPFLGADEFLNRGTAWCLWLEDIEPAELRALPEVSGRVAEVKAHRGKSRREGTRKRAEFAALFAEIRQPKTGYLLIPCHSSEARRFIPMGLLPPDVIVGNSNLLIPDATLYHFGILSSGMHMAWVRYVCGRLESRYRYSKDIVYNNFPWPQSPDGDTREAIERAAQGVLDGRAEFPKSSLADLYDPVSMPAKLTKAHQALDRAVDSAYGKRSFAAESERVVFLFELYQKLTSLLPIEKRSPRRRS
ncbi:MAG: class I SAM-dependent DNA methyltransferase [Planctomycetes bacterium]|nr:class I SAM-dependent DNA methyltransferase [Planctomycetota bacterium]